MVPRAWRNAAILQPLSLYGMSSFNYTLTGLWLLYLLHAHPERSLHFTLEYVEAWCYVWQGIISFKCDAVDLGVPSWSHPVDRICATLFTIQQSIKYCFVDCRGPIQPPLAVLVSVVFVLGFYAFRQSCTACQERALRDYRYWHVTWHFAFPVAMCIFYAAQVLAPAHQIQCEWAWYTPRWPSF